MSDVVIIGSGISGMLVARELCAENLTVTIVERAARTGQESSWAGGGILSPLYPWRYDDAVSRLAQWSQRAYADLCAGLHADTGIDPEWTQSGLLITTPETDAARQWGDRFAQPVEVVPAGAMVDIEPAFGMAQSSGVFLPEVAQVRNPRLLKALKAALLTQGVTFVTDTEVTGFLHGPGRIHGIKTRHGELRAGNVVVASGAWSRPLLATLGQPVPTVEPVQGQMLLFRARPDLLRRMVLSEQRYVIPRRDGRILVGSTLEHVGFHKQTTPAARDDLLASAQSLVPALADCPLEQHWAGLRPGSPKGIPYIYEDPEITGLFVNCGHYRNGVVLGPASARLLADQLLQRTPILPLAPYALPGRDPGDTVD